MFSSRPNYTKLRTNLRLCINRFKLLEKKKTELALKSRKEIADYISAGKEDRARIRVEHIIREDYLVEAMEIVEMLCDLVLARFGLIEKMVEVDPGLEEAIATVFWVTPRLSADVQELREVSQQLTIKFGKEYAEMCRKNGFDTVNEKVVHKLSLAAPPKILVENYMIEIAKTYKVPFEPDAAVMLGQPPEASNLIDLGEDGILAAEVNAANAARQKHMEAMGQTTRNDNRRSPSPPGGGSGGGIKGSAFNYPSPAGGFGMFARHILKIQRCSHINSRPSPLRHYSLYEPDYLNVTDSTPSYEQLNIKLQGYDFAVLESFAKHVHNLVDSLAIDSTM